MPYAGTADILSAVFQSFIKIGEGDADAVRIGYSCLPVRVQCGYRDTHCNTVVKVAVGGGTGDGSLSRLLFKRFSPKTRDRGLTPVTEGSAELLITYYQFNL